jgi:hypothetical protein
MPRIYTSESDPLDFCLECFPDEDTANDEYGTLGDGPDDRGNCFGYDEEHPPYNGTDYRCETCRKKLTHRDDHI